MYLKQFGGSIKKEDLIRYQQSPNWIKGSFKNSARTELTPNIWKIPSMIYKQLSNKKIMYPQQPIPIEAFDIDSFMAPSEETKFIWYGHAVVLIRMNGKTLLIDPMLGPDTTPMVPTSSKRFSENTLSLIDDFPPIDLVLFTHDHYDHLDFASIQKLKEKVKHFYVALGVKRHLECWGVAADIITELDWWDTLTFHDIDITFTPTQHFSGRGLTDRLKSLWGGWAFKTQNENIWFSGDGGYGTHFKEIGKRLGPFDFAFMECGQYNDDWRPIHMFPDESVQAAIDVGVDKIMPFHCAGFALSYQHSWFEPLENFVRAATEQDVPFSTPAIGQIFTKSSVLHDRWWE
ncbi:MAG: L-ascorbate metabolism protein UlaG (beta-lactamase superfamily) [Maribacter sp.]|jgi:L-ascorbate metabolism protein UlaG (beta-lactamase superfamily)